MKRYTSSLAVRNVRNSMICKDGIMVHVYSVDCFQFCISGQFSRPLTGEVVYGTTLLVINPVEVRADKKDNMTKKLFLTMLILVAGLSAFAQLGTPKTTVKDTFYIYSVLYNGTQLSIEDWPDTRLVEDAVNIYIAGYTYRKGKITYSEIDEYEDSWGGHIDYFKYDDAMCNGTKQKII